MALAPDLSSKKGIASRHSLFALTSIVYRWFMNDVEFGALQSFACFDSLSFGALLAWMYINHPHRLKTIYPDLSALAIGSAALLIMHAATNGTLLRQERLLDSFVGAWAICFIVLNYQSKNFSFHNRSRVTEDHHARICARLWLKGYGLPDPNVSGN